MLVNEGQIEPPRGDKRMLSEMKRNKGKNDRKPNESVNETKMKRKRNEKEKLKKSW